MLLQVSAMGPLIDAELERTDRRHAQLTRLSHELVMLKLCLKMFHVYVLTFPCFSKCTSFLCIWHNSLPCLPGWCSIFVPQSDARSTCPSILRSLSWCSPSTRGCRRRTRGAAYGRLHANASRAPSSPAHGPSWWSPSSAYGSSKWGSSSYILPSSGPFPLPWIPRWSTGYDARWENCHG